MIAVAFIDVDTRIARYATCRHAYSTDGYQGWLQAQLSDLNQHAEQDHDSPLEFAKIYAAMGNTDKAMQYLEQGYAEHDVELVRLQLDPVYDDLHPDPRFRDLIRRIGLPENVGFN